MLANPGAQSNAEGDLVGLQLNASDPDGNVLTFSASGLPLGLNINAATGLVRGLSPLMLPQAYPSMSRSR